MRQVAAQKSDSKGQGIIVLKFVNISVLCSVATQYQEGTEFIKFNCNITLYCPILPLKFKKVVVNNR